MESPEKKATHPAISLLTTLTIVFAAAYVAQIGTMNGLGAWYAGLEKPAWNPPGWAFAPVWTVLYLLMGTAAWMIWRCPRRRSAGLILFGLQLALNVLWPWLFFTLNRPDLAALELAVLVCLIVLTIGAFFSVRKTAGLLLLPYLAWSCFALLLNFSIWQLNTHGSESRRTSVPSHQNE